LFQKLQSSDIFNKLLQALTVDINQSLQLETSDMWVRVDYKHPNMH